MVLVRAIVYATLFASLVLVLLPMRLLSWSGISRPETTGVWQAAGMLAATAGGAVALWCVVAFALVGKGTPAPFDAPGRLVVRGPYGFVRNPMYLGAVTALGGAALYYESAILAAYAGLFFAATHAFVLWYEEPALRTRFGADYDTYRRQVRRWRPRLYSINTRPK